MLLTSEYHLNTLSVCIHEGVCVCVCYLAVQLGLMDLMVFQASLVPTQQSPLSIIIEKNTILRLYV